MGNRHLIPTLFLILVGFVGHAQQGVETFPFKGISVSVFDEKTRDYKETGTSQVSGRITINYIDNVVEIVSSGGKRSFKLIKVGIEPGTLRELLELDEKGEKYVLAKEYKYATLIGVEERIVYNRTP